MANGAASPVDDSADHDRGDVHDVVIMGGGLAGLTLALQLRQRCPGIDVRVLERRAHPVPAACHKVGESSVEVGAHYFSEVLGLHAHLEREQLKKFGFRFFFSEGRTDLDGVLELGASRPLAVTSYQLDRGLFENFLAEEARRQGVRFDDGSTILGFELAADDDEGRHQVQWRSGSDGSTHRAQARWLIDASGRAGLMKRRLGLAKPNAHRVHAVWFRIADRLTLDDWADDPAWRARCDTPTRWLSTNHLVGTGYWVWLIPLASGSHSVGIVADPAFHALEAMNTFERAMDWLGAHQPLLHAELEPRRAQLQDFMFLRNVSYDCTQLLSDRRWALTGEAGRFLDPFYSPGSDFIAYGNTLICELVARDRAGRSLAAHTQVYEQVLRSFYDSTLTLYEGQYAIFGDPEVLPVKVLWDYTYYWGVVAQIYFHGRLADLRALARLRPTLTRCQRLNDAVQEWLREASVRGGRANPATMIDQAALPWFAEMNRSLVDTLDDVAFQARIEAGARRLHQLATELLQWGARRASVPPDGARLRAALADAGWQRVGADGEADDGDDAPLLAPFEILRPGTAAPAATDARRATAA
ncbi:MAG: NAD(P)/FAD-dependent oxidoreductase [Rubrivivax sp.]